MLEKKFVELIYQTASTLVERPLLEFEKQQIIQKFNTLEGSAYVRAKQAVELVIGRKIPGKFITLEKAGSINNLQNLLSRMQAAAIKWQNTQDR